MARSGGDVSGGMCLLGAAGAPFGGAKLAATGDHPRARYSAGDIEPSRAFQRRADFDFHREWRDHHRHGCFAGFFDSRHPAPSRAGTDAVARGNRALGDQRVGVRAVVLEAGWGRAAESRVQARAFGKLVSFSANAEPGGRRCVVVSAFYGLSVSRVQYQHGFFADGYGCAFALGQGGDDDAIFDFADDCRAPGCAGGQRSVEPFKTSRVIPRMIIPCMRFSGRAASLRIRGLLRRLQ